MDAKMIGSVMVAILATGTVLKIAGDGYLGASAQKAAKYVTLGYGV